MTYNVYVARLNNTDKRIKSKIGKRSSLSMAAYIYGETIQDETDLTNYSDPKKLRIEGEVVFKGMILPEKLSEEELSQIHGLDRSVTTKRLTDVFRNIPDDVHWKNHIYLEDHTSVARFWKMNDDHIFNLERQQYNNNQNVNNLRIYTTYVMTLPVANVHFPAALKMTREDILPIAYLVVFDLIDQFFLSHGIPVLFGFHLSVNDDDEDSISSDEKRIHVHLLVPTRSLRSHYLNNDPIHYFDADEFREWLRRKKLFEMKESLRKNVDKLEQWEHQHELDPSPYNLSRVLHFKDKVELLSHHLDAVTEMIVSDSRKLNIKNQYEHKFFQDYLKILKSRVEKNKMTESLFTVYKSSYDTHLDTNYFTDHFKKQYALKLNQYLAKMGILKEGYQLYTSVPSGAKNVTTKEMKQWGLTHEQRDKVNYVFKRIFAKDYAFYQNMSKVKLSDRKILKKRHLIVHVIKRELKDDFLKKKKEMARDLEKAKAWAAQWDQKLTNLGNQFYEFLNSLVDAKMFNVNWRNKIKNKLHNFFQQSFQDTYFYDNQNLFEPDIKLDLPKYEQELTIDELTQLKASIKPSAPKGEEFQRQREREIPAPIEPPYMERLNQFRAARNDIPKYMFEDELRELHYFYIYQFDLHRFYINNREFQLTEDELYQCMEKAIIHEVLLEDLILTDYADKEVVYEPLDLYERELER